MLQPELSGDFATLMDWADEIRRMKVRTNAETPRDAAQAREFGAEGIGLCRTEHMFFDERPHRRRARDDPGRRRERPPRGAGQAPADAALGFRRAVRDHGRAAGDHPPARPAAARIPAAYRRGDRRSGRGAWASDEGKIRAPRWRSCTSSTRCSAIAAAGWRSPIPRSPRCRRAPSSRRPSRPAARRGSAGRAGDHGAAGRR